MANFIITSNANSVLVEIDGKKASFSSGEVVPYTPDGVGDTVYLYEKKGVLKNLGRSISVNSPNLSGDRIPMTLGTDNININGTTSFADADAIMTALRAVFFLASLTYIGEYTNFTDLNAMQPPGAAGRFAYVLDSQGTPWLPGSIGGAYYGAGWYYDTGSIWANKNDAIFEGLHGLRPEYYSIVGADFARPGQTTVGLINQTTSYEQYLVLDFTPQRSGTYELKAIYEHSINSTTTDFLARIRLVNLTTPSDVILHQQQQEGIDSGGGGVLLDTLSGGVIGGQVNSGTNQRFIDTPFTPIDLIGGDSYQLILEWSALAVNAEAAIHRGALTVEFKQ